MGGLLGQKPSPARGARMGTWGLCRVCHVISHGAGMPMLRMLRRCGVGRTPLGAASCAPAEAATGACGRPAMRIGLQQPLCCFLLWEAGSEGGMKCWLAPGVAVVSAMTAATTARVGCWHAPHPRSPPVLLQLQCSLCVVMQQVIAARHFVAEQETARCAAPSGRRRAGCVCAATHRVQLYTLGERRTSHPM